MWTLVAASAFKRDLKRCRKRHLDMTARSLVNTGCCETTPCRLDAARTACAVTLKDGGNAISAQTGCSFTILLKTRSHAGLF